MSSGCGGAWQQCGSKANPLRLNAQPADHALASLGMCLKSALPRTLHHNEMIGVRMEKFTRYTPELIERCICPCAL